MNVASKALKWCFFLQVVFLLSGCAARPFPPTLIGNDQMPFDIAPFNHVSQHESDCIYTFVGLFSWGDASITSAKEYRELQVGDYVPRMSRVSHIDMKRNTVLGTGCVKTIANGLLP